MNDQFDFKTALVPGILNWENPWEKASYIQEKSEWAVIETKFEEVKGNHIAILDSRNDILSVFEFLDKPLWLTVGVFQNRFIDKISVEYEFGSLKANEKLSIFITS